MRFSLDPTDAFDVACMDNNTVAVTSGYNSKKINIVDIENKTITQSISTEFRCYGITYSEGFLYYCVDGKGIFMINLQDSSVKHIMKCDLSTWSYVSSFNDKLYYAQINENTVTCCDFDGKPNWTFQNDSILVKPGGLTIDNDGNIYIISRQHNSVVVISPDGQQSRTLISGQSELKTPTSLKFDKDSNHLLITNESKSAFLFDIY